MRALLSLACLLVSVSSHAAVIDGSLFGTGDGYGSQNPGSNTVDFYGITMNSPGQLNIDIRSWERDNYDGAWVDLNGDGEAAFFDSYISLFNSSVSVANLLDEVDDAFGNLGADGSIYGYASHGYDFDVVAGKYWIPVRCVFRRGCAPVVDGIQTMPRWMIAATPRSTSSPFYGHAGVRLIWINRLGSCRAGHQPAAIAGGANAYPRQRPWNNLAWAIDD